MRQAFRPTGVLRVRAEQARSRALQSFAAYWLAAAGVVGFFKLALMGSWPLLFAVPIGLLSGWILYAARARRLLPQRPRRRPSWAACAVLFGHIVAEEIVWRGWLLEHLRKVEGPLPALVVGSVLFALSHYSTQGQRAVAWHGVLGLVFGGLYLLSEGLVAPLVSHMAYNGLAMMNNLASVRKGLELTSAQQKEKRNV